jgi:hypothetical protein
MNKKLTAAAAAILMSSFMGITAYAQASANDGVAGAVENVGEGAGDIIENVGEGVGEVAEGVGDAASDVIDGAGDAVEEIAGGDSEAKDGPIPEPADDDDLVEITDDDDITDDPDKGKSDADLERIKEEQKYYDKGADKNPATGVGAFAAASAIAGGAAMVAYLTKKRIEDDTDNRRR